MTAYEHGAELGRRWVRECGKTAEINRVASLLERHRFFVNRPGDRLSVCERLALVALGNQGQLGAEDARDFREWLESSAEGASALMSEPAFARGFVAAVHSTWYDRAAA